MSRPMQNRDCYPDQTMGRADQTGIARASEARARLVTAASALFYAEGVRNVPVERVLEVAHVTRSTLYRYFETKDDLVVAYILFEDSRLRAEFADAASAVESPAELLQRVLDVISRDVCRPGFRGCP